MLRKIILIDEDKCDGCGACVPGCAEGAIEIIDGKARLVKEVYCDGLGACLGECPTGALTIEEREADAFDPAAVAEHLTAGVQAAPAPVMAGGCPGARLRKLQPAPPATSPDATARPSQLSHWPVQLALVPPTGAIWEGADVLISADCVAFAMPDFNERLLAGKTLAVACPKLDDVAPYVEKLSAIFAHNDIKSITVAHMEVPCCSGIVRAVAAALSQSGRTDIPVTDVTVGIDGQIQAEV